MNNYRIIAESAWKRRVHCSVFRNYIEPAFCVTFEADITRFCTIRSAKTVFLNPFARSYRGKMRE